ncbi:uncharacterized protein A4U43_C07F38480 [Asparagus officinalis]|uniref:Outer envelope pore protein 24, chloroplastic n=1 Tax=Asparagus officinalis TaxID=4686 RepID=A0A5P1EIK6_ASPOF|nr:outer envelope pore protein 24B, chloroplastic-like isoform X1 [Asparagus officinalis]XP_020275573.1 outer envelope pore protein 24B, chloroplastic-like isoform X2 [Asparagus officinalis]ONK65573.1 uncharacterized protein A4U43_C07F38480 [Asparagus officinalis]
MKAKVKGRYEAHESNASVTLSVNLGRDLVVRTTMANATLTRGPSLTGLELSLHNPNSFNLRYDVPKKDIRLQFTNKITLMDKTVRFAYNHAHRENQTSIEGSTAFDQSNRVRVYYDFGSGNLKVKYVYAYGFMGRTTVEPCYDVCKNAWGFALLKKLDGGDFVKATYNASDKDLGLEWKRKSKGNGSFKISASLNLTEQCRVPKLKAESTWNYEI